MDTDQLDKANDAFVQLLTGALRANLPNDVLPPDQRVGCAQEFLDFMGRVFDLLEGAQPSPAKGAALLYVVQRLGLDKAESGQAQLMLTLVGAMNQIQDGFKAAVDRREMLADG